MTRPLLYLFAFLAWLWRPVEALASALVERWQDIRREWALRNVPHDTRCWCSRCRAHRRRFMRTWVKDEKTGGAP